MIGWGKAIALALALFGKLADAFRDAKMRKAGRDDERAKQQGATLDAVGRAARARPTADVVSDSDNRDG